MRLVPAILALWLATTAHAQNEPIIDMHFHVMPADSFGPEAFICSPFEEFPTRDPSEPITSYLEDFSINPDCPKRFQAPRTDEELLEANAEMLTRRNLIVLADGPTAQVDRLASMVPGRVIPALGFGMQGNWPSTDGIRAAHADGTVRALSEVTTQYVGVAADDPELAPYWQLAEELDLPVGIHMGPAAPGFAYFGSEAYRAALSDPLALENVLLKHPRLRVYVMHAGWPMADRMIALLFAHPQVYAGIGAIDHAIPRAEFHDFLKRLVNAGFGKRILFGSDQMVWPETIEVAIDNVESADFLTEEQKRDILYNNAARFLRLSDGEVASHHEM